MGIPGKYGLEDPFSPLNKNKAGKGPMALQPDCCFPGWVLDASVDFPVAKLFKKTPCFPGFFQLYLKGKSLQHLRASRVRPGGDLSVHSTSHVCVVAWTDGLFIEAREPMGERSQGIKFLLLRVGTSIAHLIPHSPKLLPL